MSDVAYRARELLERVSSDPRLLHIEDAAEVVQVIADTAEEIDRLRAGGPWVEHVERQRAMKRERDGDCICDTNPETTNGPEETCPWHGREYRYWVDVVARQADEIDRLHALLRIAVGCCGKCPEIVGGGIDCTCAGNPRCPNNNETNHG
ncbi:hypothetical protein PBI_GAIA_46 [Mycobacterium phage Gaia]|uniref:Uncharacterized protein n=1 Tax=Mycobacterium phage Gaia TaxID=1486472 RepID=A0A068F4J6_9CAUD|nr:hypothetical protein VC46_gp046 [Mycobacterium phage Gaia]AID58866.1 hypothetical protein PBI_GAIA_46 [Mycobacterium phage Gaia]AYQ99990.1 hypothetical protein PBI_NEBKISS_49 [Mycobacterium phage Nebkiss]